MDSELNNRMAAMMGWILPDDPELPRTWLMWSEADLGYVWSGWWAQEPEMDEDDYGEKIVRMDYAISGHSVWNPSGDIAAAWLVVEYLRGLPNRGVWLEELSGRYEESYRCGFSWIEGAGGTNFRQAIGDTAPHAICLAALEAMEARRA